MPEKPIEPPVRIIGSRELHQNLTTIMREVEQQDARYVLTVHGKPKAVLLGATTCLKIIQATAEPTESLLELQLSALLGSSLRDPQ